MDPELQPLAVEPAFCHIVRAAGGEVVTDLIANPTSQNADFVFRRDNIIAELKCLDTDTATQHHFKETVAEIMRGVVVERDGKLPPDIQRRLGLLYKKRLDRVVEKADRQIRDTAALLGILDASGVLLLANNNDSSLRFDMVYWAIANSVRKFPRINLVIFLSLNKLMTVSGETHRAWVEMNMPKRKFIPKEWKDRLCNEFAQFIGSEYGVVPKMKDLSRDEVLAMQFVRRTPIYRDQKLGDLW